MRDTARRNAITRIKVVRALRDALEKRGFLEVETPMLQTQHGGASARPFITNSNAFDADLKRSERLDAASWKARSPDMKLREGFWSLFGELF